MLDELLPYYSDCLSYSDQCEPLFVFFLNQANICQVMPKKPFSSHIVYTPNLQTRLQSLLCEAKFSKEDFCKVLVIKL